MKMMTIWFVFFRFSSCSSLSHMVLNWLITTASPFANKPFNLSDFPIEHFQALGPFRTGRCDFPCTPQADHQIVPISAPVARPPKQTAGSGLLICFSPACTYHRYRGLHTFIDVYKRIVYDHHMVLFVTIYCLSQGILL